MRFACLIAIVAAALACGPAAPVHAAETPATLTRVNLAATDVGGGIEEITGVVGPGFIGRRLIDGRPAPAWKLDWFSEVAVERKRGDPFRAVDGPDDKPARLSGPTYPADIVVSFFGREPALIGAVTIALPPAPAPLPKNVEVWTSLDSATDDFEKVAERSLSAQPAEQTLAFPAREARYVRLRILSGTSEDDFEIAEVRVLESSRSGYVPLFTRAKDVKHWKGSPRDAAQRGLEWLQQAAVNWNDYNNCFGCHVQGQVLMGQAVALKNGYRISVPAYRLLADSARASGWDTPAGWAYVGMALESANAIAGAKSDPAMLKALDNLVRVQSKDGAFREEKLHLPIIQGPIDVTGNALVGLDWAAAHGGKPTLKPAASRALAWMTAANPVTTQDKVFKIITLARFAPDKGPAAWALVDKLASEQQADGGWKETADMDGSNAFATGQVLYAYQQAGVSVMSPTFRRGVDYLLKTQVNDSSRDDGIWRAIKTQSSDKTDLAPTMWAVIGLAAAYGEDQPGALQVGEPQTGRPPLKNLEIVLDVSGSMNAKLGGTTRWQTALDVLKKFVATLPEDMNVALRVYGHRYASKS
ncbi:MAG TPA: VWA domain-containing protein, partial [Vicinamibacterales bacterium]|nr:VWA domain-containing protein [Vicinamibacterales bacterium]